MSGGVICPHGDPTCPCQDSGSWDCHYEGGDAMICPNPPLGFQALTFAHCHVEGCEWHVNSCNLTRVSGECGLLRLGFPPATTLDGDPFYSMNQAKPGSPAWACGWIRTPLNVSSREEPAVHIALHRRETP